MIQTSSILEIELLKSSSNAYNNSAQNVSTSYDEIFQSVSQTMDAETYKKNLSEKFGGRVAIASVSKNQQELEKVGSQMGGRDVIIAPNIFEEMLNDSSKADYYESKIQHFFDNIPKYTSECAAMGLTFEPCGVVVHEDGTVTFICGGGDSPERVAEVKRINELKQQKKLENLDSLNELMAKLDEMRSQADQTVIITTKKFLPDGSIETITREDGKIVERHTKKPHMIAVDDPINGGTKLEPFLSIFEFI